MTLEEFAKLSGVTLIECDPVWGGRIGYKMADAPNMAVCGFRTANSAYREWMISTFGKRTAKAVEKLLKARAQSTTTVGRE